MHNARLPTDNAQKSQVGHKPTIVTTSLFPRDLNGEATGRSDDGRTLCPQKSDEAARPAGPMAAAAPARRNLSPELSLRVGYAAGDGRRRQYITVATAMTSFLHLRWRELGFLTSVIQSLNRSGAIRFINEPGQCFFIINLLKGKYHKLLTFNIFYWKCPKF